MVMESDENVSNTDVSSKHDDGLELLSNENASLLGKDRSEGMEGKGLGIVTTSMFIIGDICGAGGLVMPMAVVKTGLPAGLLVFTLTMFLDSYCGHLLSKLWLKDRDDSVTSEPNRDAYPRIGEIAGGTKLRCIVSIVVNVYIVCTCTIYLILSAKTFTAFVSFHLGSSHALTDLRIWLVITACIIYPMLLLGTPKDNWVVAVLAGATSMAGLMIVWIQYIIIYNSGKSIPVTKQTVTPASFASAFGTFAFALSGATLFPSLQTDMKKPENMTKAIGVAYLGMAAMYIPTAVGGYLVVGGLIKDSILDTLSAYDTLYGSPRWLLSVTMILFAVHFLGAFVIYVNPAAQQFERIFGVPYEFSLKRVGLRGVILLIILAAAEILPSFGDILDLAGGSLNVFICFIFPIWFYLKLFPKRSALQTVLTIIVLVLAIIAGIAATITNIINVENTFEYLYAKKGNASAT